MLKRLKLWYQFFTFTIRYVDYQQCKSQVEYHVKELCKNPKYEFRFKDTINMINYVLTRFDDDIQLQSKDLLTNKTSIQYLKYNKALRVLKDFTLQEFYRSAIGYHNAKKFEANKNG